jgi:hypothetical protein
MPSPPAPLPKGEGTDSRLVPKLRLRNALPQNSALAAHRRSGASLVTCPPPIPVCSKPLSCNILRRTHRCSILAQLVWLGKRDRYKTATNRVRRFKFSRSAWCAEWMPPGSVVHGIFFLFHVHTARWRAGHPHRAGRQNTRSVNHGAATGAWVTPKHSPDRCSSPGNRRRRRPVSASHKISWGVTHDLINPVAIFGGSSEPLV